MANPNPNTQGIASHAFKKGEPRAKIARAVNSPAQKTASAENGKKGGRPKGIKATRRSGEPNQLPCKCGREDMQFPSSHKATCPRYRAWKRQIAAQIL